MKLEKHAIIRLIFMSYENRLKETKTASCALLLTNFIQDIKPFMPYLSNYQYSICGIQVDVKHP